MRIHNFSNRILQSVKYIFCFEMSVILYLHAGLYKADPTINSIFPIDITLFFFIISTLVGAYIFLFKKQFAFNRHGLVLLLIYFLFLLYAVCSFFWTPSNNYAVEKLLHMGSIVFWTFFSTSVIISSSRERVKRFFILTVSLSVWISLLAINAYLSSDRGDFVSVMGSTYLGSGQLVSLGIVVTFGYFLFFAHRLSGKLVSIIAFVSMISVLLILGGRGPLLATFIALMLPLFYGITITKTEITVKGFAIKILILLLLLVAALIFLWQTNQQTVTLTRLVSFFQGTDTTSSMTRFSYYHAAFEYWKENLIFGNGIGSWPILHLGEDVRDYPHNIFLEIAVELGLVGLILFIALLFKSIKTMVFVPIMLKDKLSIIIVMLFASSFFSVLLSGDIPDNRLFFANLGLMSYLGVVRNQALKDENLQ